MMAVQRGQLLTLPPELIWELLYILILDHLHSVFFHEQTWDAVAVLPSTCSEIRIVALNIYSNVFNIPQAPDGSLTRNPHPDIEWVVNIDRGLTMPLEGVDTSMITRLYGTIFEKTFTPQDHGLLGVYAMAAQLRCCLAIGFGLLELFDDLRAVFNLRNGLAAPIQQELFHQMTTLKPQRLAFLAGEVLMPEALEILNILDLTTMTCGIGEIVYHHKNPDAEDAMPDDTTRMYTVIYTEALEAMDHQDSSSALSYVPISTQSAKRSLVTPRLLNLSEVLYPLYEATQAIPQDEEDKDKLHDRLKTIYHKWDAIVRNDNLARGLPAPDHDQPWDLEGEETVAEQ